jgi:hypothetical protein
MYGESWILSSLRELLSTIKSFESYYISTYFPIATFLASYSLAAHGSALTLLSLSATFKY